MGAKYTVAVFLSVLGIAFQASAISTSLGVSLFPTGNSNPNVAGQLGVTVDYVGGKAVFEISNALGEDCTIKEVQFYDGSLFGISSIEDSTGVSFSPTKTKRADKQDKYPSANFGVTFSGGGAANGVDPGESLTVHFDLKPGATFSDLLEELSGGTVYLKLHVISIGASGDSDWYVSNPPPGDAPPTGVPDGGATIALLGVGILTLAGARRVLAKF